MARSDQAHDEQASARYLAIQLAGFVLHRQAGCVSALLAAMLRTLRHATHMSVLLFDLSDTEPSETIELDPRYNRTGDIWHVRLGRGARGKGYALRVDGPWAPDQGHRFDPAALLLDPHATTLVGSCDWDLEQLPLFAVGERPLSSTAQDLARCKKSEIDHLNGVVVRKGEALGVRTPVNRTLLALVKLLEERKETRPAG